MPASSRSARSWSDVVIELEAAHRAIRGPRWHLVQMCAGFRDRQAVEWLRRRGFHPYYPLLRTLARPPLRLLSRRQRKAGVPVLRQVLKPLFPRYCFVRFDRAVGGWRDIFAASGVTGIVCEHNQPVPIADDLIERLLMHEVDGAIPGDTPACLVFRVGQLVEITEGPLSHLRGEIEKIRTETIDGLDYGVRMTVLVDIFGRFTPVELGAEQIDAVGIGSNSGRPATAATASHA